MSELAFPLVGTLIVFGLAIPLVTVGSKLGLLALHRRPAAPSPADSGLMYVLLVAPVVGPVAWFASAALHQSESGYAVQACLEDHFGSAVCRDALFFAVGLTVLVSGSFLRRAWPGHARQPVALPQHSPASIRLRRVCASSPQLSRLRVRVVAGARYGLYTHGLLRPQVVADRSLLQRLDDGALRSALLHEAAHVRSGDPLRFLVVAVCLALNPAGRLLRREHARWLLAREASCDDFALDRGADPLDLAQALVVAARSPASALAPSHVHLGADSMASLRLRVQRLLELADQPWQARPRIGVAHNFSLCFAAALVVTLGLPHWLGSAPLDYLHVGIERFVAGTGLF